MYYGDKKEAMVKIMVELVLQGWKAFGYRADESDSMTDYYSPAYWNGLATKNGYVLVIDNYNTHYSGYEKKEYNYNNDSTFNTSDKITKLKAKMNDAASTQNEKMQCARLIERQQEREASKRSEKVIEVYPTFLHGNPKNCSWHIEKNDQIVAKGTGVFACNDYDWENKEVTKEEQKSKKVLNMVKRFEAAIKQDSALESEVIKVAKTVTKPVEKTENTINVNDILSFSYHGHFWIVTSVYHNSRNETCVVYELLGSEKRGFQRTLHGKRYYQPLKRLEIEMTEGKTKVYTLQEVTEYVEKTIYKKTAKKVKQDLTTPTLTGEVEEVTTAPETTQQANEPKAPKTEKVNNSIETNVEASFQLNNVKNGIEIKFNNKPSKGIIEALKENGFRWFQPLGFWCAKQTAERLTFATMICETYNSINEEIPEQQEHQQEESTQEAQTITEEVTEPQTEEVKTYSYDFGIDLNYLYHDIHFKAWNDSEETLAQLLDHKNINYYISGGKFICIGLTVDDVAWCEVVNKDNAAIIFYDDKYNEPKQTNNSETIAEGVNNVTDFQEYKNNITGSENDMTGNIANMFDDIIIENNSRIASDDQVFCKEQEEIYKQTISAYNNLQIQLDAIKPLVDTHGKKFEVLGVSGVYYAKGSAFDAGFSKYDLEKNTIKIKERFISNICNYFMKKYSVTIEYNKIQNKYDLSVTYEQIIDEIYLQLGGYNFTEKAEKEMKDSVKDIFRHGDKINIKNTKLILDGYFVHHDSIWKEYKLGSKHEAVFKALQHFEDGSTAGNAELIGKYIGYNNERNQGNYERYELITMTKVKSIKFLKNGKLEIEFSANQQATRFAQEYCGYSEKSSKTA